MKKITPTIDAINDTILSMPLGLRLKMNNFDLHLGASTYFALANELNLSMVDFFAGMRVICKSEYPLNSIVISPKPKEPEKSDSFIPLDIFIVKKIIG